MSTKFNGRSKSGYLLPSGVGSCFEISQPRPPTTRHFEAKYKEDYKLACRKRDKDSPGGKNFMCKVERGQKCPDGLADRLSSLNSPLASALDWVGERSCVCACERAVVSESWKTGCEIHSESITNNCNNSDPSETRHHTCRVEKVVACDIASRFLAN